MSFPRYPKYKPSGVQWLGDIPAHWAVAALGFRFEVALGKMLDAKRISGAHLRPYLRNTDVQWGRINTATLPEMDFEPAERHRYRLVPGDMLVCEGGEVGRSAIWDGELGECYYQKALHRVRPLEHRRDSSRFMFWAMHAAVSLGAFASNESKATIAHLPAEDFRRTRFVFPPVSEQHDVVEFLERETAKLDALVDEQERFIELLKEKRQAVISHAVTKGLNPNAPMKDSGIEWLGQIPAHWQLERGRHLYSQRDLSPETDDGVVTAFRDGQVTLREKRRTDGFTLATLEVGYQRVLKGDLVIHGMDAFAGAIGVSEDTGKCTPEYAVLAPTGDGINNDYFALALRLMALRNFILVICPSVRERAPRFRFETFKDVFLPVPPIKEQEAILQSIRANEDSSLPLLREAQRVVELLQERRAALISAAVTGQIDVRPESQRTAA